MLEKQSLDEFLSNINNGKTVIVSLSPQSRASIAVHYGLSPVQVHITSPVMNSLANEHQVLGVIICTWKYLFIVFS